MELKGKKLYNTGVVFVVLILLVCLGLVFYNNHLRIKMHESTEAALVEVLEQQRFNFTSEMNAEINIIKSLAISLSYIPDDIKGIEEFMQEALLECNFDDIIIVNTNGKGLNANGEIVDISDMKSFNNVKNGETLVMDHSNIIGDYGRVISIMTPITRNKNITGILSCTYSLDKLDDLLMSSFAGKGYAFVVTTEGEIIARTNNNYVLIEGDNLYNSLDIAEVKKYDDANLIKQNMQNRISGRVEYKVKDELRHAHYAPIEINNWSIFTVVPEEVVTDNASDIMSGAIILTFSIVAGFIIFFIYVLLLENKNNIEKAMHTAELEQVAYYDTLTGIPNINKFKIDATNIIKNNPDKTYVAAKLDIVNFKVLNEMFGYEIADKAINNMGKCIIEVRKHMNINSGCVARITADEFIILDEANNLDEIDMRIKNFESGYNEIVKEFLGSHRIRFRYGRYIMTSIKEDINSIIGKVNLASRTAKQLNLTVYDYNDEIMNKQMREAELEGMMGFSIENNEFKVYLQPKYMLTNEKIVGAEALVRWKLDNGKMIFPNEFIPLFERNGSIVKLDMYMLEQVCKLISQWIKDGITPVPISVNFSRVHLQNNNLVHDINKIAEKYNTPKKYLEIELTESSIYDNEETLLKLLEKLHESGFALSMDDFGTGYSSLGLLKNLPVDTIKLDRGFFSDIVHETRARIVIESVIDMAKKLNINTVAEGVETEEHVDLLKEIGCDIVQGYYYAKPMPAEEFLPSKSGVILNG